MQHWELLCPGGLSFVCDDGLFQPSTDSFLLGSFPRLKPGLRVCDLGSGTGLLGLLLFQRQRALSVTGVELLLDAVRLAEQAAARNGLADRLIFRRGDLRKIRGLLPAGGFDLVVCNPPYYPAGSGRLPETEALRAARSETGCTLEDICTAAAWLLRWGGSFCLVHKPERLTDEEYEVMKKHTVWGREILSGLEFLPQADLGATYHHERYDGSGYPYGMHGEELPEMVRIISAADALDAMNSNRCYRKHCDRDYIIGEFRKGAGKQFDAGVAQAVVALIEEGRITV